MAAEMTKKHVDRHNAPSEDGNSLVSNSPGTVSDEIAFAFDIDGVFMKGGKPLPEGIEALKYLNGNNPYGIKVPYIFVTNGGGKTEEERCLDLSRQLQLDISPGQLICGHTPMREMVDQYHTVLVVGGEGEKCRIVAEGYGFKDVITPGDIIKTRHDTTPFRRLTDEEYKNSRFRDLNNTQIDAIFVFADSRDWAGDEQIILDCLMTQNGHLGRRSMTGNEGPPLFFSHNDVIWPTSHEQCRIGMGALKASLEAVYKVITGKDLLAIAFGKPQLRAYDFASRLLQQWRKDNYNIDKPLRTIYFVGDTPESDICGTNESNKISKTEWVSVLVKTGVYQDGDTPRYPPAMICDSVLDAVKDAVEREHAKCKGGSGQ